MNNSYVNHFNYCQWLIHKGAGSTYSKRIILNTVGHTYTAVVDYLRLVQ